MDALSYANISIALSSWEKMKQKDRVPEKFGTLLLENLFAMEPKSKEVFGLSSEENTSTLDAKVVIQGHGNRMVYMFDTLFSSVIGPDSETVCEILSEVGERHVRLGISKSWFAFMGMSLIATLEETMESGFDDEVKEAWLNVYEAISTEMTKYMD